MDDGSMEAVIDGGRKRREQQHHLPVETAHCITNINLLVCCYISSGLGIILTQGSKVCDRPTDRPDHLSRKSHCGYTCKN